MQSLKLIQVIGFHHSGTSILRKIIGNHRAVFDILSEGLASEAVKRISAEELAGFSAVVAKAVAFGPNFGGNLESADRCILTIRNPLDTMASLILRNPNINAKQQFRNWESYGMKYLEIDDPKVKKVSYEGLFESQFRLWKEIFFFLEIDWTDSVVLDNQERKIPIHYPTVPDLEPERVEHEAFRSWQINQPFQLMNGKNRGVLSTELIEEILDSEITQQLNYLG